MKKQSAKNVAIGLLMLTSAVMGAFLFALQKRPFANSSAKTPPTPRRAYVPEANLNHNTELQACYETFLSRGPAIEEGVVEMHWLLEKSGRISDLELVNTELNDQTLVECLMSKLSTMTFHAPTAPVMVAHKFNFKRRSPGSVTFH